jgi:hypothetical protein
MQDDQSGVLGLNESLLGLIEGFDFVAEVLEIPEVGRLGFGICLEVEYLFNQSAEVMQGAYRRERQIAGSRYKRRTAPRTKAFSMTSSGMWRL